MAGAKPTVVVLFGGRSSEHGVSCSTAGGVLAAIDRDQWDVRAVGITAAGAWTEASADPADWSISEGAMPSVLAGGDVVLPPFEAGNSTWRVVRDGRVEEWAEVAVVFPLLHGPWGEDGTVQGLFELTDVRYVGSGVLASSVGMDKEFMKTAFRGAGLPVAADVVVRPGDAPGAVRAAAERLGLPVFVKPARAGSSMGISKVSAWDQLDAAIADAAKHDPKVLVEQAMVGREIETAVLAVGGEIRVSSPGEVAAEGDHEFYDFDAKYLDESHVRLECPAELRPGVGRVVGDYAARAFRAVGAEGLARVDCFVDDAGLVTVNEINTMPGFTPTSMYPRMWAAAGVEYPELVQALLQEALERPLGLR